MKISYKSIQHISLQSRFFLVTACLLVSSTITKAQLNPMASIYFQNQYQVNPAMAGIEQGMKVNLGLRQQWSSIPGAPKNQAVNAEYGFNKAAVGLNIHFDAAGLQRQTRVMGTYAYHLPLGSENQKLNFGLSAGFMSDRIDMTDMVGDDNPDMAVNRYNDRRTYLDGDFGLSYTSNRLTIQGALPNMKTVFKKDDFTGTVDRAIFFSAISYKLDLDGGSNGMGIEPKFCFRGIRGFDNIADMGANFTFINNSVNLLAMYHTSKSATFGMGMNYKELFRINGMYTTETAALRGYTSGNFELALSVNVFK